MRTLFLFCLAILAVGCTCNRDENEKISPYPDGKGTQQQNPR